MSRGQCQAHPGLVPGFGKFGEEEASFVLFPSETGCGGALSCPHRSSSMHSHSHSQLPQHPREAPSQVGRDAWSGSRH